MVWCVFLLTSLVFRLRKTQNNSLNVCCNYPTVQILSKVFRLVNTLLQSYMLCPKMSNNPMPENLALHLPLPLGWCLVHSSLKSQGNLSFQQTYTWGKLERSCHWRDHHVRLFLEVPQNVLGMHLGFPAARVTDRLLLTLCH